MAIISKSPDVQQAHYTKWPTACVKIPWKTLPRSPQLLVKPGTIAALCEYRMGDFCHMTDSAARQDGPCLFSRNTRRIEGTHVCSVGLVRSRHAFHKPRRSVRQSMLW
jgi:hypothetical protein